MSPMRPVVSALGLVRARLKRGQLVIMSLILAAAQSKSVPGEVSQNVENHLRLARVAAERGVQLIVFPELSLTGYELALAHDHTVRPDSVELNPLRRLAADARITIVVGGPLRTEEGQLHITAFALRPDGSVLTYTKVHVHQSEQHVFTSGPGGPTLRVEDATIGLAICADASFPEHAAKAAAAGADVYAAGVMITDDAYARKTALLKNYALEHKMAVLMANYSGESGG
ncbi:MAG TPA: carbon-nitrogen hydrolase family protein, partial [Bryobacteraceae bacterium]|nr:carbon-nitrogen hydrolase family protein [Bryobacteraceae bacterium]